jgi:hypothetical protein
MLRPSFVPPAPIRRLRDYTRLREDLTRERSRYWQQLEKLLEDAAIKVSAAGDSRRSQGRAWKRRVRRLYRRAVCPAPCQVVICLADGVAGVIASVAMRKSLVVAN